jgi:hypothetical protein
MATAHCGLAVSMSHRPQRHPAPPTPNPVRRSQLCLAASKPLSGPLTGYLGEVMPTQLEPLVLQYTRIPGSRFMQGLAMPCNDACAVDSGLLVH